MMKQEKFNLINKLEAYLKELGLPPQLTEYITLAANILSIALIVYIIDFILNKVVINILRKATHRTRTKWDDYLMAHDFFKRSSRMVISIILVESVEYLLKGHDSSIIKFVTMAMKVSVVVFIVMMLLSVIDSLHDAYRSLPRSREKSIKNYMQTFKVVIYTVAVIVIIVIIFNLKISSFLTGMAASAAVLSFVFKDTLLGFVASIQLSVQDMVRLGDWIEIPSSHANGNVVDMNLTTVKVRNWDNTFSFIPIYHLTNNPYVNWRGMIRGGGRRFTRKLYIDFTTIRELTFHELDELRKNATLVEYYKEMVGEEQDKSSRANVSLLRRYLAAYLSGHSYINSELTLMVRYREIEDIGLPLELYAFTKTVEWVEYEDNIGDIIEHAICVARILGLKMFQRSNIGNSEAITITKDK